MLELLQHREILAGVGATPLAIGHVFTPLVVDPVLAGVGATPLAMGQVFTPLAMGQV